MKNRGLRSIVLVGGSLFIAGALPAGACLTEKEVWSFDLDHLPPSLHASGLSVGVSEADGTYHINVYDSGGTLIYHTSGSLCSGGSGEVLLPHSTGGATAMGISASVTVTGDFNGDGILDFAILSGNDVAVSLGTGNASAPYGNQVLYPVGQSPNAIAAADLNGDGVLDLVVVNQNDATVSVLLGEKNGTFQPQKTFSSNGSYPITLAIGDLSGDGRLDIVVSGQAGVQLFPGNGDGTVGAPVLIAPGTTFALAIADFTGDSKLDVLYTGGAGGTDVYVLPGNGLGAFGSPIISPGAPSESNSYFGFAYGDFNHDGIPDIMASRRGYADVYLGKAGGTFAAGVTYASGYTTSPAFALDNLGNPYLVTIDPTNQIVTVLIGNPDGTVQSPPAYFTNSAGVVLAGDFNGDGKPDAVDISYAFTYALTVLTNTGGGTFSVPNTAYTPGNGAPIEAATGDFNGDGQLDVVVGTGNGLAVFTGNGNGTFQTAVDTTLPGTVSALAAADFNGDGKTDLAIVTQDTAGPALSILLSTGGGTFSLGSLLTPASALDDVAAVDLNGDGKPDLVVAQPSSGPPDAASVYVLLNQGSGTFGPPVAYAAGYGTSVKSFIGDVNGDGKPDLAVLTQASNSGYALAILLGNGDGTFQTASLVNTAFGPTKAVFGDFNADGKMDMVVSHCCGDTAMSILLGNGDGTFQPETLFPGGYSPVSVVTADFNGDGKPDLLTATEYGYDVLLLNTYPAYAGITNAASFAAGGVVAPNSIAAAFGKDLATGTASAAGSLGTSLDGTGAVVIDSTGAQTAAPLFFVSPGQVNLAIPEVVATGPAQVLITSGDGTVSGGPITVNPVSPGVFSLNGTLAAAETLQANSQGQQAEALTFQYDSTTGGFTALPIDLGESTDTTFLILYGTGIRGVPLSGVGIKVGTMTISPAYAGPQGSFTGEDQINVQLPYSLKGAGDVTVTVTAQGASSNPVHVTIQ